MQKISQLTESLASAIMSADTGDLPQLARMHTQFQAITQEAQVAADLRADLQTALATTAGNGEKLLERIILQEVDDAAGALTTIGKTIAQLQQLISGGAAAAPSAGETAAAEATSSAQSNAQARAADNLIEEESALNADDLSLVGEFIGEATGHIESAEAAMLKLEDEPDNPEALSAIFRSFHTIKGVAGFLNLKQIGKLSHAAENLLDLGRQGKIKLTGVAADVVLESIDLMKAMVVSLDQSMKANQPLKRHDKLPALLERLHACAAGELGDTAAPAPTESSDAPADAPAKAAAPGDSAAQASGAAAASGEGTVKVATNRLDTLINMVGELVIAQSMVSQDVLASSGVSQRLARNMGHLGKITRELQDLSMSMRMVPIQGVFQKMARLVRDLSRKAGKQVDFVMTGGDTELDRNVVEAIGDPLVHMVRNAVDHGVEAPEKRVAAGKGPSGRIELMARHQAGNIVIEIRDDGKGLDKARVLAKATAAGLVKEGQEMTDQDIFRLIFHPGLSTAEKVTDVSGRGVGMDVVKRNVEALRGRIDIASEINKGSTFTIRLPLTLAVIDGMIVKVGAERYILPMTSIEQSIQPRIEQLSTVHNRDEMVMVRGRLIPLFRLHRVFNVAPVTEDPTKALVVIVQDNLRRCGLLVDELLGQQQVVIKSLGQGVGNIRGVSGGAILGDGNISLILDVPGLIDLAGDA